MKKGATLRHYTFAVLFHYYLFNFPLDINTLEILGLDKFLFSSSSPSSSFLSVTFLQFLSIFSIEKPISGEQPRISNSIFRFPISVLFISLLEPVSNISNKYRTEVLWTFGRYMTQSSSPEFSRRCLTNGLYIHNCKWNSKCKMSAWIKTKYS